MIGMIFFQVLEFVEKFSLFFCFFRQHGLQGLDSLNIGAVGFLKLPLQAGQLYLGYLQLDLLELLHPPPEKER